MNNHHATAQVIDFSQYKPSSTAANKQLQLAYMPVVFYYPVYIAAQPVEAQPQEPKAYVNNVVSIYDYLGEI